MDQFVRARRDVIYYRTHLARHVLDFLCGYVLGTARAVRARLVMSPRVRGVYNFGHGFAVLSSRDVNWIAPRHFIHFSIGFVHWLPPWD